MQGWGVIAGWRTAVVSLQLPASEGPTTRFTLCVITTKGEAYFGWLHSQIERTGRSNQIAIDLVEEICQLFPMVSKHPNPKWIGAILSNIPSPALNESLDQCLDIMQATIQRIQAAK
jgi:hypothetical protein